MSGWQCLIDSLPLLGTWFGKTKSELCVHFQDAGHAAAIEAICGRGEAMDFYQEAIAITERNQVQAGWDDT